MDTFKQIVSVFETVFTSSLFFSRDVSILSAYGTAAVFDSPPPTSQPPMSAPVTEEQLKSLSEKTVWD